MKNILTGKLVRLVVEDTENIAKLFARWSRDSEYMRLLDTSPARLFSEKATKEWLEKEQEKDPPGLYMFMIRTLEDNKLIGEIDLDGIRWSHGDAWVGIGIGERDCWDKGYGSDAMNILLRYAFTELNLHRVTLTVFEYNPRAIRAYEKAGFQLEGRARQFIHRDGNRWDLIFMGILREEWEKRQASGDHEI